MLHCPLCQQPLATDGNSLVCRANHRFDRARQGYYNLLPVQFKRNLEPGDNSAMVEARRRFLDGCHYAPFARRLMELAAQSAPASWLDIGCGEGYYSAQLTVALPGADGYALDISREAVKRAARRSAEITWLVASMARVPLTSSSLDLITSIFSPIDWAEALRLLKPGGAVLRLGPATDHLLELRQQLYAEVRDYQEDKHLTALPPQFSLAHSETLRFTLTLDEQAERADLLAMTPHGWRATADKRAQILANPLCVTIAGRFDLLVKGSP